MAQWCELHVNLLEELDDYMLLYDDKVRIRAVCESWYTHLPKLPNKKERKFPWLLKEIDNIEEATHALFSPIENKFYYIYLPEAQGKLFKGSSHGWVVTVEDKHSTTPDICLINPLTRALMKLPPRTKFPDVRSYCADKHDQEYIVCKDRNSYSCEYMNRCHTNKFVMLSDPCGNDCVVVAIYRVGFLACCKSNHKKWTPLHFGLIKCCYVDIIVHKGKLHALNAQGGLLHFESIGFGSTESKVTVVAEADLKRKKKSSSDFKSILSSSYLKYLVECSDGELIMVARCIDFLYNEMKTDVEPIPCTRYFEVFKLDMNSSWVEVKNIGNDIVFLGLNSSFSVPSNQFPSCKGN